MASFIIARPRETGWSAQ